MTPQTAQRFAPEELAEQFPNAPLQEVSFEVRFAPKLRIASEIWRMQEALASEYPQVGTEPSLTAAGLVQAHMFHNADGHNRVMVSQSNFALLKRRYPGFSAFLQEALAFTNRFCSIFGIDSFTRAGLRYSNQFLLPGGDRAKLSQWVSPFLDLSRVNLATTPQFIVELRSECNDHGVTARSALLSEPAPAYVLDTDCYAERHILPGELVSLLPKFHDSAKGIFLDHIKPVLKEEFRRKA